MLYNVYICDNKRKRERMKERERDKERQRKALEKTCDVKFLLIEQQHCDKLPKLK